MRNASIVLVTIMLVAATGIAASQWSGLEVVDWVAPPVEEVDLPEELEKQERLEATKQEILSRIAIKQALVAELIEGRKSLQDVSETFLSLNQPMPGYMLGIRQMCPGNSDLEKTAYNVLTYVDLSLASENSEVRHSVRKRLHAELEAWFPATSEGEWTQFDVRGVNYLQPLTPSSSIN